MNNSLSNTKRIAFNGIIAALTVIALFAASVLPTSRLSLYALSSFFSAVIIIEFGIRNGWIFYISSCLLALIIVPNKIEVLPYIIFFGVYGIIKFYIEKLGKIVVEYFLKLAFFNISMFTAIFFIKQVFVESIRINFPWWVIIILFEIVFIVYDYIYTLFIQYYVKKLKHILKI